MPDLGVVVVVPLFNKEFTIKRAIDSILQQTYTNYIVCIVDDGSTDNSAQVVEYINDSRIRYFYQDNQGPGSARNRGINETSSKYVAFLDADDEWDDINYLSSAISRLEKNPDCHVHVSGYYIGSEKKSREKENGKNGIVCGSCITPTNLSAKSLKFLVDFFHTSCVVCERTILEKYGGFYANEHCLFGEDSWLWLKVLLNDKVYFDPTPKIWFHTEYSSLGAAKVGCHPRRPALSCSSSLYDCVSVEQHSNLKKLLAFYRMQESLQLSRKKNNVDLNELGWLYHTFPHPAPIPLVFRLNEIRVFVYSRINYVRIIILKVIAFWRCKA